MNKSLLLFAAAWLIGAGATAQDAENLIVKAGGWNVTAIGTITSTVVSFTSNYGEFKLTDSSISKSDYKGFKIEFSDLKDLDGGGVHLKIGKAVMDGGSDNGVYQYVNFSQGSDGVLEGTFSDDLDNEIATFNAQCNLSGESVTITKVTLVKTDGTEVVCSPGSVSWGCSAEQKGETTGLTFTGQYGYGYILAADGSALTYDPETEKNVVYTYTVELDAPTAAKVTVELDALDDKGGESGFAWYDIEAGSSSTTFEVSAEKVSKAVSNIYIKGTSGTASDYPFSINFKSITRTKVVNRDKTIDETKNKYTLDLKNGQVILASDLEKFDDNDLVVISYSCAWEGSASFNGWGVGGLRNPEDKANDAVSLKAKATPGDYTYVTFIDELKEIVGHHAAEAEGENADTEEWDGIYWFTWGLTQGSTELTTTKGSVTVYSDKVIKTDALPAIPAGAEVVSSVYYNAAGRVSAAPFRGLNIVRQTLSDGTTRTVKTLVK